MRICTDLLQCKKMALDSFRLMVLEPAIMENVTESMITIVERARSSVFTNSPVGGIDKELQTLKETIQAILELGSTPEFYEEGFESPFLKSSTSFYKNAKGFLKNKSQMEDTPYETLAADFVKHEQQQLGTFLSTTTTTLQKAMDKCTQELLNQSYESFLKTQQPDEQTNVVK
mmetsp:Transcript_9681/g.13339  ORF Transcript_9681/g.13339 Transcript_9681/m.13339 type:complete len:173 (+) Transcript_9681:352-870(+)